ncbi:MAG: RNA polymerase factor sigma-54 [Candidatus Omnitrophica bacterium]|nr:RNA polymerase factor sigma-54 [Candidatus Omnitrophota bacterium]
MELKQHTSLRHLLVPQLQESLQILALSQTELRKLIEQELGNNPLLEEAQSKEKPLSSQDALSSLSSFTEYPFQTQQQTAKNSWQDPDLRLSQMTKKTSLQEILLRQLGMFTNCANEFAIGQEIIGNIDENGYLTTSLEEIAKACGTTLESAEVILKLIQQFEPAGVGARNLAECLLIQLDEMQEHDPLLRKLVSCHLEDIAKKNFSHIAKVCKETKETIDPAIKKIHRLNPKPGRAYCAEQIYHITPDIIIEEKNEELKVTVNDEEIPSLQISKDYLSMLKQSNLDENTQTFLKEKLTRAMELLRAVTKRKRTLKKIVEALLEIQLDAIKEDLSFLKPLTLGELAQKIGVHESTVCRAVMNKYVRIPSGVVALKDFFSSHLNDTDGHSISSTYIKTLIKDLIEQEDKRHPLSDQHIALIISQEKQIPISRRTITKYREELKILSTTFRREK